MDGKLKSLVNLLNERVSAAIEAACGAAYPAMVRAAADGRFGDYQANGVMAAAKAVKTNPRELAERVVAAMEIADLCEPPEVAGPGFINLRLKDSFLAERLLGMHRDSERLGIDKAESPQTVVVDYSGPNIAKQMHVGHLRSTIIGDCIARLYDFSGHRVIRQNHIGDWGTQFGMLIAYLRELYKEKLRDPDSVSIRDLEQFYQNAKRWSDTDAIFAASARQEVVNLHNNNQDTMSIWAIFVNETRKHYLPIYETLNVTLRSEHERGESFYADKLAGVVEELKAEGLAVESDGAVCVFPEGFKNKDGQPLPFIIQKSDGAFLYATTDLARCGFGYRSWGTDRDLCDRWRQAAFSDAVCRGEDGRWVDERTTLEHVTFGTMLGEDGRPFKTRTGGTVKLKDLLDEAIERAAAVVEAKNPTCLPAKAMIAKAVGVGGQVRRLRQQPKQRLCVQLRQDAGDGGQHRPVYAVRLCPHQVHRAQGGGQGRGHRKGTGRYRVRHTDRTGGERFGQAAGAVRSGDCRGDGGVPAELPDRLSVRCRTGVQPFLYDLSGTDGRPRKPPGPTAVVRSDRPHHPSRHERTIRH